MRKNSLVEPINMRHGQKPLLLTSLIALLAAPVLAQPATDSPPKPPTDTSSQQLDNAMQRGDALFDEGIVDRALVRYLEAEKLDPTDLRIKLRLAKTYLKLGNRAAGLAALGSIFTAKPELRDNADLTQLRVALEALPKEAGAAATNAAPAPATDPSLAERTTSVALAARAASLELVKLKDAKDDLTRQGILDQAWKALRPALAEFDIDSLEAWKAAAIIALGRKDNDLAALAYEAILRIQPGAANDNDMLSVLAGLSQLGAKDRLAQTRQQRAAALALLPAARRGERAAVIALAKAHLEGAGLNSDLVPARAWVKRLPVEHRKAAMREVVQATVTATLDMAKAHAVRIKEPTGREFAMSDIAVAQAKASDICGAKATAAGINSKYRGAVLQSIAEAQAKAGDIAGAKATAASINDSYKDLALRDIAVAQAKARDISGAKNTVASMTEYKNSALCGVASAQAEASDISGAKATAASISDASDKNSALCGIAEAQAKAGDISGAKATAASINDSSDLKSVALRWIAKGQANVGDISGAMATAASIKDSWRKNWALIGIAEAQAEACDISGARATFAIAVSSAARINESLGKDRALYQIAEAQAKAGDIAGAKATYASVENPSYKGPIYEIARCQAKAGDISGAKATLASINDADMVLRALTTAQSEAGDIAGAKATLASIEDSYYMCSALCWMAGDLLVIDPSGAGAASE